MDDVFMDEIIDSMTDEFEEQEETAPKAINIKKLQKQNEIMRKALKFIQSGCLVPPDGGSPDLMDAVKCAEEALNKI